MSSFNSSSLNEILKRSTTSSVLDKLFIVSEAISLDSVWEKILKFISNIVNKCYM